MVERRQFGDSSITGHVVGFLNDREVVFDIGSEDGVRLGMRFAILVPGGIALPNDESGRSLGIIDHAKTVVKIVRVPGPHASVGRTFKTVRGAFSGFTETSPEKFSVDSSSTLAGKVDMRVKVGDPVRVTQGDEFIDE
jgi:hypothetical protein